MSRCHDFLFVSNDVGSSMQSAPMGMSHKLPCMGKSVVSFRNRMADAARLKIGLHSGHAQSCCGMKRGAMGFLAVSSCSRGFSGIGTQIPAHGATSDLQLFRDENSADYFSICPPTEKAWNSENQDVLLLDLCDGQVYLGFKELHELANCGQVECQTSRGHLSLHGSGSSQHLFI